MGNIAYDPYDPQRFKTLVKSPEELWQVAAEILDRVKAIEAAVVAGGAATAISVDLGPPEHVPPVNQPERKLNVMATNPQIPIGSYVTFAVTGTDANGNPAVSEPGDVNTAVSSSPSLVVAIDSVPQAGALYSGTLSAVAPAAPGVTVVFTEAHSDGTSANITDTIDVVPLPSGESTTLGVTLGTPTPGPAPVSAKRR